MLRTLIIVAMPLLSAVPALAFRQKTSARTIIASASSGGDTCCCTKKYSEADCVKKGHFYHHYQTRCCKKNECSGWNAIGYKDKELKYCSGVPQGVNDGHLAKKTTDFGFTIGDKVYWAGSDDDVPPGTRGEVVGFTSKKVEIKFPKGTWNFPPGQLSRDSPAKRKRDEDDVGGPSVKATKFGFTTGENVYWEGSDEDTPSGTPGEVVGFTSDKAIVTFPKGTWHFAPEQLSRDPPGTGCPSSAWACKCTTAEAVTELPLLKDGSVRKLESATQPTFYINPVGLAKYETRLQDSGVQIQCEVFFHRGGLDFVPCEVCESTDGWVEEDEFGRPPHPGRCFDGPVERAAGAIPGMCLGK
jgi:hypothetical protein